MQTIQRRILLNTLDKSFIEQRLWSLLYGRGLFSFVRLYGSNIELQGMGYYYTDSICQLVITCGSFSILCRCLIANDYQCHCRFARRAQEITFVNDSFVFRINYLCQQLKVLQLCHTKSDSLFSLGYVNIYFSMGPYTLWGKNLIGVVIHPYL